MADGIAGCMVWHCCQVGIRTTSKETAIRAIRELPDSARWEDIEERVRFLTNPDVKPFKPYKAEAETYKVSGEIVKTGNTVLPQQCSMCGYRSHCWPNAVLHDRVTSRAKSPPQVWYSTLKKKAV